MIASDGPTAFIYNGNQTLIEVRELRKEYGEVVAVGGVDLTLEAGEIFGLLGPNGAGKSTTIGCICGLLTPTSGRIRIMGHDIVAEARAAKQGLGIVPQELAIYEDVSAYENVSFWGAAYGLSGKPLRARTEEVLARVGLADRAREAVKGFSGGMKRRLNFACGIVHRPQVLLLDEPTVGVDPQSRVKLLDLVREQASQGTCVLYTTHYMEEAERLCDRVGIIDHGVLIAEGTRRELVGLVGEHDHVRLELGGGGGDAVADHMRSLSEVHTAVAADGLIDLTLDDASVVLPRILTEANEAGARVLSIEVKEPDLEEVFLQLTGRALRN